MDIIRTDIDGVLIIQPTVFKDQRGFFFESYNYSKYAQAGIDHKFVQDNHSKSIKNTLRGLHAQNPFAQTKLVRVLKGKIFDVAVDVRKNSPTFGKWVCAELSDENFRQFLIPKGFLHGFCVLTDTAEVEYKCDQFYHKETEITVRWDDPQINIDWPVKKPILSQRDSNAPLLKDVIQNL